ncbi:hypothetical protein C0995_011012 [Termitomyces sp. Mi166|nr:hypothetical protein C0995_011012 [Termitomyces sp. Mi166\
MALAQAVAAAPKATFHPPASPFAELLRRSKFATHDPAIRQAYQAPPANAHRGDWGVKRPISLRRRDAFISLTSFEHHAHFTEWNHAENQVRFIRQVEEMGGKAVVSRASPWHKALGIARSEPPFDSDFCPGESPQVVMKSTEPTEQPQTVNLALLGKRGKGAYGTQREEPSRTKTQNDIFVTHNADAMSKREFKRYLRSLRAQRSDFQEFVNAEKQIEEKDLYALAQEEDSIYYRRFLQSQMKKEYADYDDRRIQPQPHPNGAIVYAEPSAMEIQLWNTGKPGFFLNEVMDTTGHSKNVNNQEKNHLVSFGGLTSRVTYGVVVGTDMLLDKNTEEGVRHEDIEKSVLEMRLDPSKVINVERLPRTVGRKPEGLKGVKVAIELIKDSQMGRTNPHPLGNAKKTSVKSFNKPPELRGDFTGRREDAAELLSTLSNTMRQKSGPGEL